MIYKPVPRKGTLKLLQLLKSASEGDKQELLEYIGRLEQSEEALLGVIQQTHRQFSEESFVVTTEAGVKNPVNQWSTPH